MIWSAIILDLFLFNPSNIVINYFKYKLFEVPTLFSVRIKIYVFKGNSNYFNIL